ncbi:MAG: thymidine phosphorylase [Hyphomicrobiaceae bacterium]|nr:thymidine phosphorylase [Hyphomicrobiaceae bacterium]
MLPQELIRKTRDKIPLSVAEIDFLVRGLTDGSVTEGQISAFAMAVFFNGLTMPERVALTRAMTRSGTVLQWNLPGPVLDKHSSGGVGDNVSLMLAPAIAACGGYVPMISGRGLGHTGGTLDKLDAIPGYQTQPGAERFAEVVRLIGCAIIGQTADLAPADKRFYAIRDVTATVESIDLITASILSKKLAAGLQGLVLDVKWGTGAFMSTLDDARGLARSLATVASGAGLPTVALLTDMNEPLASAAGNALEVRNAVEFLTLRRVDKRLWDVTVALGAEMLVVGGLAHNTIEGARRIETVLTSGAAAELFARMVGELGGPIDLIDAPERYLEAAPLVRPIYPEVSGRVAAIDTRAIGVAVVEMKGGRARAADVIDYAVGFSELAEIGAEVGVVGEDRRPLAIVHARGESQIERATVALRAAYRIGEAHAPRDVVTDRIDGREGH